MIHSSSRLAFAAALLLAVPARAVPTAAFGKVLVVVLENSDYDQAAAQPFLKKLAKRGALLTNYRGIGHPSQPNYVAMIAGDAMGVDGDGRVDLDGAQLGDLLEAKGLNWAVYAEGYPGSCFLGARSGDYVRKHVPFLSFTSVQNNPARCARVKDAAAFDDDAAARTLPAYSMYVPDLIDDGHDTSVAAADRWLSRFLGPRLDDANFMKGLLVVVTFDEDEGGSDGRVFTVMLGDGVRPGGVSDASYDHVSLLRTIEKGLGLGDLGRGDASASAIDGVWK